MTHRAIVAILVMGPMAVAARAVAAEPAQATKAITSPSQDLTLSLTRVGRIAKVLVRQGQNVRAGDLLVQLEDSVERRQVGLLKAKADDTSVIRGAELKLTRAKKMLAKVQVAYAGKAAPQRELEDAQLNADMAEIEVIEARLAHEQDIGKYEQAALDLERMRLTSPSDGEVERLRAKAGESVDALAPLLRLVNVDPLWIGTPVPLAIGRHLSAGRKALVRLPGLKAPAEGKVIHVSRVADAASKTLEVRVELPNPTARPAGEHVTVTFPDQATAADPKRHPDMKEAGK